MDDAQAASAQALRTGTRDRTILYHAAAIAAAAGDRARARDARVARPSTAIPSSIRCSARRRALLRELGEADVHERTSQGAGADGRGLAADAVGYL